MAFVAAAPPTDVWRDSPSQLGLVCRKLLLNFGRDQQTPTAEPKLGRRRRRDGPGSRAMVRRVSSRPWVDRTAARAGRTPRIARRPPAARATACGGARYPQGVSASPHGLGWPGSRLARPRLPAPCLPLHCNAPPPFRPCHGLVRRPACRGRHGPASQPSL